MRGGGGEGEGEREGGGANRGKGKGEIHKGEGVYEWGLGVADEGRYRVWGGMGGGGVIDWVEGGEGVSEGE